MIRIKALPYMLLWTRYIDGRFRLGTLDGADVSDEPWLIPRIHPLLADQPSSLAAITGPAQELKIDDCMPAATSQGKHMVNRDGFGSALARFAIVLREPFFEL